MASSVQNASPKASRIFLRGSRLERETIIACFATTQVGEFCIVTIGRVCNALLAKIKVFSRRAFYRLLKCRLETDEPRSYRLGRRAIRCAHHRRWYSPGG